MKLPISLIISTYNWPQALELCLQSVLNQSVFPKEIIIADDGSGGTTRDVIEKFQAISSIPVKHVWHEDLGFRKSIILNESILAAKHDYIIQIDGDVILDRNFIYDHITVAERGVFVRGTRAQLSSEIIPDIFRNKRIQFHFLSPGVYNRFNAIRIPSLSWIMTRRVSNSRSVRGSNLAFWKDDFIRINGYNNELQGWGHEDEELACRFVNSGILKKKVKFKAIQFHLAHRKVSRKSCETHVFELRRVREGKVRFCSNGYRELSKLKLQIQD